MGQQKDWCSRRSTQVNTSYYLGQSSYLGRNIVTTSTYKKADDKVIDTINLEAKELATELDIGDRIECLGKQQAFITLKDHKENSKNAPTTCRLVNPAKSEMGLVSKQILGKIYTEMRRITSLNQWKIQSQL